MYVLTGTCMITHVCSNDFTASKKSLPRDYSYVHLSHVNVYMYIATPDIANTCLLLR